MACVVSLCEMNMFVVWLSLPFYFLSFYVESTLGSSWSNGCNRPLGLQDRRVHDSQLSSPSFYEYLYIGNGKSVHTKPEYARLNNIYAWCASGGKNYYIQVDFHHSVIVTGIATQGFSGINDYYVKEYRVVYSQDGVRWNSTKKVWRGNSDAQTVVNNTLNVPISARYIRVYPVSYNYNICIRMELYGCTNYSVKVTTPAPNHTPSRTTVKATTHTSSRTTVNATSPGLSRNSVKTITQASRSVNGTTKSSVPWAVLPGERVEVAETGERPGKNVSSKTRETLVIWLTVTAAFLLIAMVPVVMFLILLCHRRHKRCSQYKVGSNVMYDMPLTTTVVNMDLCNQEIDTYSTTTEKYNSDGITLLSSYVV